MCTSHLGNISVWTSHISNAQEPRVATGYCNAVQLWRTAEGHCKRTWAPGWAHAADLSCWLRSAWNLYLRKQFYLIQFQSILLPQFTPYHNKYILWGLTEGPCSFSVMKHPFKEWTPAPMGGKKKTSKTVAQVWKITKETFSALRNTFQNKPIPGEHVVPQTFCSFSHIINLYTSWSVSPLDSPGGRREGETVSFSLLRKPKMRSFRQCFSKSENIFTW